MALSNLELSTPSLSARVTLSTPKKKSKTPARTRVVRTTTARNIGAASGSESIQAHLQPKRHQLQTLKSSCHSNFDGTLLVSNPDGKKSYVSASRYLVARAGGGGIPVKAVGRPAQKRNKRAQALFCGGRFSSLNLRRGASPVPSRGVAGTGGPRPLSAEVCPLP